MSEDAKPRKDMMEPCDCGTDPESYRVGDRKLPWFDEKIEYYTDRLKRQRAKVAGANPAPQDGILPEPMPKRDLEAVEIDIIECDRIVKGLKKQKAEYTDKQDDNTTLADRWVIHCPKCGKEQIGVKKAEVVELWNKKRRDNRAEWERNPDKRNAFKPAV